MSFSDQLRQLDTNELPAFRFDGDGVVSYLLDFPEAAEQAAPFIRPELFERAPQQYVVALATQYHKRHGCIPTRERLFTIASRDLTTDDPVDDVLGLIERPSNPREVPDVKEDLEDWLRHRSMDRLYADETIMAHNRGQYQVIHTIVEETAAIGVTAEDDIIEARDLLHYNIDEKWIVEGVVAPEQPLIIGGPAKAMKTSIAIDLAISIAVGGKFLGKYKAEQQRVLFISAESGKLAIKHTIQSILQERGIERDTLTKQLFFSFSIPSLSDPRELARIRHRIRKLGVRILFVDPLYLTLLRGNADASATNMFDMGRVYGEFSAMCQAEGVTPIMLHHFNRKNSQYGIPTLDDLAYAGASEFARQTILIRRAEAYHADGHHKLNVQVHGEGRCELLRLEINEGTADRRRWRIHILPLGEIEKAKEDQVREGQQTKTQEYLEDLLAAIEDLQEQGVEATKRQIRITLNKGGSWVTNMIKLAREQGLVEEYETRINGQVTGAYRITKENGARTPESRVVTEEAIALEQGKGNPRE